MAHFNLSEQEQIDNIKYFWKDWSKYIIGVILLLIIGYIASSIYQWYQQKQAQKAAVIYLDFTSAFNNQDYNKAVSLANQMISTLPGTEYTAMASIEAAKLAFTKKDYAAAIKFLSWVKSDAHDKSLQSIAALRLASIYIDQKEFDKAKEMLKTKHDLAFDGLFYEGRGDMYIAMDNLTKARDAYKEGLQKAANDPSTQEGIQMKLNVIGG